MLVEIRSYAAKQDEYGNRHVVYAHPSKVWFSDEPSVLREALLAMERLAPASLWIDGYPVTLSGGAR